MNKNLQHHLAFVAEYGDGPYICFFCGESVPDIDNRGRGRGHFPEEGCVHHIDGNHDNNESSNLAPAHQGCHSTHHMLTDNKAIIMNAKANLDGKAGKIGGKNSFGRDRERAAEMGRQNGPENGKRWAMLRQQTSCGYENNCGNVAKHVKRCGCEVIS